METWLQTRAEAPAVCEICETNPAHGNCAECVPNPAHPNARLLDYVAKIARFEDERCTDKHGTYERVLLAAGVTVMTGEVVLISSVFLSADQKGHPVQFAIHYALGPLGTVVICMGILLMCTIPTEFDVNGVISRMRGSRLRADRCWGHLAAVWPLFGLVYFGFVREWAPHLHVLLVPAAIANLVRWSHVTSYVSLAGFGAGDGAGGPTAAWRGGRHAHAPLRTHTHTRARAFARTPTHTETTHTRDDPRIHAAPPGVRDR